MYVFFQIINKVIPQTEPDIYSHGSLLVIFLQLNTLPFIIVFFFFLRICQPLSNPLGIAHIQSFKINFVISVSESSKVPCIY